MTIFNNFIINLVNLSVTRTPHSRFSTSPRMKRPMKLESHEPIVSVESFYEPSKGLQFAPRLWVLSELLIVLSTPTGSPRRPRCSTWLLLSIVHRSLFTRPSPVATFLQPVVADEVEALWTAPTPCRNSGSYAI